MDYANLMENVIDSGHLPFAHHGSVSKRHLSGEFKDMKIEKKGPWGFTGVWPEGKTLTLLVLKNQ